MPGCLEGHHQHRYPQIGRRTGGAEDLRQKRLSQSMQSDDMRYRQYDDDGDYHQDDHLFGLVKVMDYLIRYPKDVFYRLVIVVLDWICCTLPINSHPAHYKKCSNYVTCSRSNRSRYCCYRHHPHHHHHHLIICFLPRPLLGTISPYGSSIS